MNKLRNRMDKKKKIGIKITNYLFTLTNVLYLVLSLLMILGSVIIKMAVMGEMRWDFDNLVNLWIATGSFLLAVSIFGIFISVTKSTMMTNMYGISLSLTFIFQVAAVITAVIFIPKSGGTVYDELHRMILHYPYENGNILDWIQSTFRCCGSDGPADWKIYGIWPNGTHGVFPTEELYKMPKSCCATEDAYRDHMLCVNYLKSGCHAPFFEFIVEISTKIGLSAVFIGIVQIIGVICAFTLARAIRQGKTYRNIERWTTIHQSMGFDKPKCDDQLLALEKEVDNAKHT